MGLNIDDQMVWYRKYHQHKVNFAIHIVFVPVIYLSWIFMAAKSPAIPLPESVQRFIPPLNVGTLWSTATILFYLKLEPLGASPLVLGFSAWLMFANSVPKEYLSSQNIAALIAFFVAWLVQFYGHGHFEKTAPALKDSALQALLLAPLFVWLEVLFYFGYRPELRDRVYKRVESEMKQKRDMKNAATADGKSGKY